MVQAALGDPLRLAHKEILEDKDALLDHAHDVFLRCCRIVEIAHADIDRGIFHDGSEVRHALYAIMTEVREVLMY